LYIANTCYDLPEHRTNHPLLKKATDDASRHSFDHLQDQLDGDDSARGISAATCGIRRKVHLFPTVASILVLVSTHAMMHCGQFVPVRRALGKPILV
jgi:hypothetical protein